MIRRRALLSGTGTLIATTAAAQVPRWYASGIKQRELRFPGADGATLAGTLVLPLRSEIQPVPGVVLIAGSGPTDRDWNSPLLTGTNGSARLLADALAGAGLGSLRYDKRVTGPHAMENMQTLFGKLSMQSHVDELASAMQFLARQDWVQAKRIVVIASSEGTLHALNYQLGNPAIPFAGIVLIGPPGRPVAGSPRCRSRWASWPAPAGACWRVTCRSTRRTGRSRGRASRPR